MYRQFSIQWAGVSVAYVGMMWGTIMGWRVSAPETLFPLRLFAAGAGTLFGGGAALPFVASNFVSAYLALWLTREHPFSTQFAAFAVISLVSGTIVLKWLDQAFAAMGGLHIDLRTMAWAGRRNVRSGPATDAIRADPPSSLNTPTPLRASSRRS